MPLVLLLLLLLPLTGALRINSVQIPPLVRADSPEPTLLDCDYSLGSAPSHGLVVKWFVGRELLYQWIHGLPPAASDEYRDHVDASYKASDDPRTMYRAVKLLRPGHELSGLVRCLVSTNLDEVSASRRMLVYSAASSVRLQQPRWNRSANRLGVTCNAHDLYPKPRIVVYLGREPLAAQQQSYRAKPDGRFDAEATAALQVQVQLPARLRCEVSVAEANYTSVHEYVYSGESSAQFAGGRPSVCLSLLAVALSLIAAMQVPTTL